MKRFLSCCAMVVSLLILVLTAPPVRAEVKLPKVIGSHMVLQRDRPLPIWGWADPGEEVTVKLDEATATAKADPQGDWKVVLPAVKADGKEVAATADHPQIRLLHVAKVQKPQPANDIVLWSPKQGMKPPVVVDPSAPAWQACSPQTAPFFSAPLYFFGERLSKELHVPIGLIDDSWSGSGIEPWIVLEGKAGGMYNGMIAPVKPFAMRGAIWYQGETNAFQGNGMKYYEKMQNLIGGWRQAWGYEFPFYFVQIAPFVGTEKVHYPEGALTALWEAQVASLKIPGTGMVVVTDKVHDLKNIHPIDKLEVGNRLALWALAKDYGKKELVYSGPLYKSMKVEGNKIWLSFAYVGGGLKSRDGKPLSEFEIAGVDGKFAPAAPNVSEPLLLSTCFLRWVDEPYEVHEVGYGVVCQQVPS